MTIARTGYAPARWALLAALGALLAIPIPGHCKSKRRATSPAEAPSPEVAQIIQRIVTGEKQYVANLKKYSPRVETYLQFDRPDSKLGDTATNDAYFLGRLQFSDKPEQISFLAETGTGFLHNAFFRTLSNPFRAPRLFLDSFATSAMVDARYFDAQHYTFTPVGWNYLGDVRCLAIDVSPRGKPVTGAFEGRIWVEDRNYAIVRLNGTRVNPPRSGFYTHFDSWRENLRPGEWLPVYTYSEETGADSELRYKANSRFWGYDLTAPHKDEEWTKILVESPAPVHDASEEGADLSPVESKRQQEMEAGRNVLERLEKARLIAPAGPVDKVLETVLNNLVVTNHLDNLPPLHCRVMLTAPLESFPLLYTVVVSRGLVDVLPDEPSLAMVLAHELAHIALGHKVSTRYAFNDRLLISDEELLATLDLARNQEEEEAADNKALDFLKNSPYNEKLRNAGLFLRAAAAAAPVMPHLFGPHLGNRLANDRRVVRMVALLGIAPELYPAKIDQIAALPLGSRVQVNAWDGTVTFPNRKNVALNDPTEKMPFRVSPLYPHLARYEDLHSTKVSARQTQ
ncbi:MAG: M48 family metalloprotease [Acidobacteriia bacterium]|nr:M48 family metalloprotease [Terriglobia bacterium]